MADPLKLYPPRPEKVYFYGTCLVDLFYPEAGMAGIRLLEREGIEVIFPDQQTCCGQPAWTSGYHDEARAVARRQLALFPEPWPIVVPSGSCGGMMRNHYPRLFRDTPDMDRAREVAGRVWELTDFLLNVCRIRLCDTGEPVTVAMHTSCSARRELGLGGTGPELLAQLDNVTLVEPARAEECCGFGGTFAVRHPEISAAMVSDKAAALTDALTTTPGTISAETVTATVTTTPAGEFVTNDCGCLMNITGFADKQGLGLRGQHILSFLWQRTRDAQEDRAAPL